MINLALFACLALFGVFMSLGLYILVADFFSKSKPLNWLHQIEKNESTKYDAVFTCRVTAGDLATKLGRLGLLHNERSYYEQTSNKNAGMHEHIVAVKDPSKNCLYLFDVACDIVGSKQRYCDIDPGLGLNYQ